MLFLSPTLGAVCSVPSVLLVSGLISLSMCYPTGPSLIFSHSCLLSLYQVCFLFQVGMSLVVWVLCGLISLLVLPDLLGWVVLSL